MAVVVELKYCERCGGLWLRRAGIHDVFCGECVLATNESVRAGAGWRKYLRRKDSVANTVNCGVMNAASGFSFEGGCA